jgi:hypothetical protein
MNRLEQLLAAWEEGTLSPAEATELKQLLADPQARKALVDDWMFYEALVGALQAQPGEQPAAPRPARPAPSVRAQFSQWLARLSWQGWTLGGAVAAMLVTLALVFLLPRSQPVAQLTTLQGLVEVVHSKKSAPAVSQQWVKSGDTIKLAANSVAVIAWPEEQTLIRLSGPAELFMPRQKSAKHLVLQQGQLLAFVARQPSQQPMTIRTPQAEAIVKGTRFTLTVNRTATRLEVLEGAVALRQPEAARAALTVTAGAVAEAGPGVLWQTVALAERATRQLVIQPPGAAPLATTGALVWQETVASLQARGWPLGVPRSATNTYLQRLRGYLVVPSDGDYSFWISSGGPAEFRLSSDARPENARPLAAIISPNQPAEAARSLPQKLLAGNRLYFEVNHQLGGDETVTVGWNRPGVPNAGSLIEIIPGEWLAPWIESEP